MRLNTLSVLILFISISCSENIDTSGHENFENGWEIDQLKGEVKSLTQYKAYTIDLTTRKTGDPLIEFRKTYNKSGNPVLEEYFDEFGELKQKYEGYYSDDGSYSKLKSIIPGIGEQMVTLKKYDIQSGQLETLEIITSDSAKDGYTITYDDRGNKKQLKPIIDNHSGNIIFHYELDDNDRILSEIQITKGANKNDTLIWHKFKYDQSGNKIEQINPKTISQFEDTRTVFEYDSENRPRKATHYRSGKKTLEVSFDKMGNELIKSEYAEQDLISQTRFSYKYDEQGNWTNKKVFRKENQQKTEEILLFVKSREIEYY